LPLSFLTGFFGMNFAWSQAHYQQSTWDFFGIGVGIMLVSAAAMFILVWRKHWLR
jgi:magnesium transporter